MNIILFGSSGMIGQAALRECLLDPNVESILAIVRKPSGFTHPKYQEQIHTDFLDFKPLEAVWRGYDGCFYLVGVTSSGMSDADYRRVTYDYTLAAAEALAALNPNMTFVYGSGAGADSSEKGSVMWARVRGATENAVLALPFKGVVFRPEAVNNGLDRGVEQLDNQNQQQAADHRRLFQTVCRQKKGERDADSGKDDFLTKGCFAFKRRF